MLALGMEPSRFSKCCFLVTPSRARRVRFGPPTDSPHWAKCTCNRPSPLVTGPEREGAGRFSLSAKCCFRVPLEAVRRKCRVAHIARDRPMVQVVLDRARVVAVHIAVGLRGLSRSALASAKKAGA